jgi:hypothetical protein
MANPHDIPDSWLCRTDSKRGPTFETRVRRVGRSARSEVFSSEHGIESTARMSVTVASTKHLFFSSMADPYGTGQFTLSADGTSDRHPGTQNMAATQRHSPTYGSNRELHWQ